MSPTPTPTRRAFLLRAAPVLGAGCLLPSRLRAAAPPAGLRVFVTGHSFHVFIADRLAAVAAAAGIEGHRLAGKQSIGGSHVIQHWELPDEKNQAKAALREGRVDVLTMAPNRTLPDEGIDRFVDLGLRHNPELRVLVQESWVPFDAFNADDRIRDNLARDGRALEPIRAVVRSGNGRSRTR